MWVWSDELADRFPSMGTQGSANLPLIAYAIGGDTDLEILARDVLAAPLRERNDRSSSVRSESVAER